MTDEQAAYAGLLPCPHCGNVHCFEYAMDGGFVVECPNCACRTSICEYRQVAIETWNTRHEASEAISSLLKRVGEAEQVIASSLDALADGCPWAAEVTLQAYLEGLAAALNSDAIKSQSITPSDKL